MAAAEQARVDFLHAGVDPIEGVLEAAAGLAVDLADGVFQRLQRRVEVGVLGVQVFLALGGFGVFGDRGQVDRLQPAQSGVEVGDYLFPVGRLRVFVQVRQYDVQLMPAGSHFLGKLLGAHHQRLLVHPPLGDRLAPCQRLLVALLSDLLEFAQLVVDALQQGPGLAERAVHHHPLLKRGLALGLQPLDRVVALGELGADLFQARIKLPALATHALQRLGQGHDLGAPGFQRQGQRVGCLARGAGGVAGTVAGLDQAAALGFQRLAAGLQPGHAAHQVFQLRARFARLRAAAVDGLHQLLQLGIDPGQAVAGRIQPALLALQLAGQLGHAAMGQVQRPLRFLALLFSGQQLATARTRFFLKLRLALLQLPDAGAQRLDLALAQQRALLGRARAQHAHPAGAQALAAAGDHRVAFAQACLQRAGVFQRFGHVQAAQQAPDRQRTAYLCRQRSRGEAALALLRGHQRQPALAQVGKGADQRLRLVHQHAFDQLAERALDRVLPAAFHLQALAHAGGRIQPLALQPFHRGALLLAQRGVLQGLQRGQPAALLLQPLAQLGDLVLGVALLLLQGQRGLLARLQVLVERFQRGLLFLVLLGRRAEALGQRVQVQPEALAGQLLAAPVGVQRLPVQVVHAGALHVRGARSFGGLAPVRVPALLPVGQPRLGFGQGLLAPLVFDPQLFQPRFGLDDGLLQRFQSLLVAADVLADLGQRALGFLARPRQALGQFLLVCDLLLDPGQRAAHLVHRRLGGVQRLAGLVTAHPAGLDPALGVALLGHQLLQPGLLARQVLAHLRQALVQLAVFERLPLRVAGLPLGLDGGVLLGLARLPGQVVELLADLLAQVVEPVQVLAGVADPGLGLLAPLLVLGDAGGLLQVHAQVLGPGVDDLADHALLDDRVAARPQAGAQEQVGDVAAPAAGAVEVVVALAVAADGALDRNLVERGVLAGDGVVGVVEDQLHRRLRHRLARRGAGEDHVGQRVAAQAAGGALAHHPAHGVDDVRLAAAVGADHAGHVGRQVQRGGIDEGLEAGQLDRGQAHAAVGMPRAAAGGAGSRAFG